MKRLLLIFSAFLPFLSLIMRGEDTPVFPGGPDAMNKYVASKTRYPDVAKENGIEGIVVIGFMVQPDGSLTEIKVLRFIDPDLEREALRVVSGMPKWIPATKDGTPIEAPSKVDIPFILEE